MAGRKYAPAATFGDLTDAERAALASLEADLRAFFGPLS